MTSVAKDRSQYPTPNIRHQSNQPQNYSIINHKVKIFFIIFIILFEYKKVEL